MNRFVSLLPIGVLCSALAWALGSRSVLDQTGVAVADVLLKAAQTDAEVLRSVNTQAVLDLALNGLQPTDPITFPAAPCTPHLRRSSVWERDPQFRCRR